ncbi:5'-3' exoribonuclease 1 isoform X2 [Bacillus rossius redtenbacheri]|uniref:5'-3' exoribonuclease 1 isoform X2 n=1 Tax=Bacillus rossius redtenbacheri TaxID=93214 RepID=UPI002FDD8C3A
MGVPKFFRWISERYPCLSELVKEFQLPEFDNLYLDMNGIIHMCSHPNDFDPHFRITEEKIFKDIFHYIEVLFRMIQPQRLFFMAVDGVAPRAKMNQQRGRRFRSAKEAEVLEKRAKESGEELPSEERFDSNCITPGTVFMARLHEQLKNFIAFKISTDRLWRNCKVILSGHETPGEGEHKIMDYIRYMKSRPDYDPNTRHCLYGLDADLIMLGLCTHEPHFALLREEVKFGKQNQKRISTPEEASFYLLHLSLLREYLEMEFGELKEKLPFEFNLENIIDDWVLMGFLVGNDFIPHLPLMHIHEGALPILYKAYINVLPSLNGYLNEGGTLNLQGFEKYMEKLSEYDVEQFQETLADLKFFEGKTGRRPNETKRHSYKPNGLHDKLELDALIENTNNMFISSDEDEESEGSEYEQKNFMMEFSEHKKSYYMNKLEYESVDSEVLRLQAEGFIRAIQWNLNYYYNGVCSWSWFYPHNYAPYISDIKNFTNLKLDFEMGKPFLPFEQLLAVLPSASKNLLPEPYHHLMVDSNSPIIEYYPKEFKTDLNGKRQEWEAVVLIPFIDEVVLLEAMKSCNGQLTEEEKQRNTHGPMLIYTYTGEDLGECPVPECFPRVGSCHAAMEAVFREDILLERHKLVKGLCPGALLDVYFPGFPSFKHLKFSYFLHKGRTMVFEHPSRGENMIVKIVQKDSPTLEEVAKEILGESIFVGWPHLFEAKVVAVSNRDVYCRLLDESAQLHSSSTNSRFIMENMDEVLKTRWRMDKSAVQSRYINKLAVDIGETGIIVHATNMIGRKYVYGATGKITAEKKWCEVPSVYAFQTTVKDIAVCNPSFVQFKTLEELFPPKTVCFMIGPPHYGAKGEVMENVNVQQGRIKVKMSVTQEPDLSALEKLHLKNFQSFMNSNTAAQKLGISAHLLSRVTGSIFVARGVEGSNPESQKKFNIGLNLKFNKKNEEVPGYTRKDGQVWLYSHKAVELVKDYIHEFPELFEYLAQNTGNDVFYENQLFPEGSNKTAEIVNWLKEQPYSKAEHLPCGSDMVDEDIVRKLENLVENFYKANLVGKSITMCVKPHVLYKDGIQWGTVPPDPNANHRLFDRIVNVRDNHTIPLGYKGTITGIAMSEKEEDVLYQILFDREFEGGLTFNSCGSRGYKLPARSLLNLSHGQRLENKNNKPVTIVQHAGRAGQINGSQADQQNLHIGHGSPNRPGSAFASWNVSQLNGSHANHGRQGLYNASTNGSWPSPPIWNHSVAFKQQHYQPQQLYTPRPGRPAEIDYQAMWSQLKVGKPSTAVPTAPSRGPGSPCTPELPPDVGVSEKESFLNMLRSPEVHQKQQQEIQNVSVKQLFEAARANCVPKEPQNYCMQLLTLCQQKGLGIPIYNYSKNPADGSERAHVKLPGKQTFTGDAVTQVQAAEKAACAALRHMATLEQSPGGRARQGRLSQLPTPPQQWCSVTNPTTLATKQGRQCSAMEPEWRRRAANAPSLLDQQKGQHQSFPGTTSQLPQGPPVSVPPFHRRQPLHQPHPSWRARPQPEELRKATGSLGSPFVPLQAVKQRSKLPSGGVVQHSSPATTSDSKQQPQPGGLPTPPFTSSSAPKDSSSPAVKPVTPKPLVPKPKKSRIAANFNIDEKSCKK